MNNGVNPNAGLPANFLNCATELELANLQNLQAIHTFKYLQQPPAFLGSLFQCTPACSRNNNQVRATVISRDFTDGTFRMKHMLMYSAYINFGIPYTSTYIKIFFVKLLCIKLFRRNVFCWNNAT